MAPIDIVEVEAEVARNQGSRDPRQGGARARGGGGDLLRTVILDPEARDFWVVRLPPPDTPPLGPRLIDDTVHTAIERGMDVDRLRKQIENIETNARFFANRPLPDVNLFVDYSVVSRGGRRFLRGPGFPRPVIGERNDAFGGTSSATTFHPGRSD